MYVTPKSLTELASLLYQLHRSIPVLTGYFDVYQAVIEFLKLDHNIILALKLLSLFLGFPRKGEIRIPDCRPGLFRSLEIWEVISYTDFLKRLPRILNWNLYSICRNGYFPRIPTMAIFQGRFYSSNDWGHKVVGIPRAFFPGWRGSKTGRREQIGKSQAYTIIQL